MSRQECGESGEGEKMKRTQTRNFAGGWSCYRDVKYGWFLVSPDHYERFVGMTWLDSVPQINLVLDNHGINYKVS